MIVPDINLLLYAVIKGFKQHDEARKWLEDALNGPTEIGLAAPTIFGFVRLSTNRRVLTSPLAVDTAGGYVEQWLAMPRARFLLPGPRHLETAFGLLRGLGTGGNLTTDVQLAALAIEYQADLYSNDTDFGRFPGLRWVNPLQARP